MQQQVDHAHTREEAKSFQQALQETDARQRLALAAHATLRQWESGASMMLIHESATTVDVEAAAELKEARAEHMLRPGLSLDPAQATAVYLSLMRP